MASTACPAAIRASQFGLLRYVKTFLGPEKKKSNIYLEPATGYIKVKSSLGLIADTYKIETIQLHIRFTFDRGFIQMPTFKR